MTGREDAMKTMKAMDHRCRESQRSMTADGKRAGMFPWAGVCSRQSGTGNGESNALPFSHSVRRDLFFLYDCDCQNNKKKERRYLVTPLLIAYVSLRAHARTRACARPRAIPQRSCRRKTVTGVLVTSPLWNRRTTCQKRILSGASSVI